MLSKNWAYRIIMPVYQNNKIVTFTSRDTTGKTNIRYKHCPNNFSIIPIKQTLYNIDNCNKYSIIVVEGIFDVWRMGDDTTALYGTQATLEQVFLFRKFRRVNILFDATAEEKAHNFAQQLNGNVKEINIILMEKGDPADLTPKKADYIKKQIL